MFSIYVCQGSVQTMLNVCSRVQSTSVCFVIIYNVWREGLRALDGGLRGRGFLIKWPVHNMIVKFQKADLQPIVIIWAKQQTSYWKNGQFNNRPNTNPPRPPWREFDNVSNTGMNWHWREIAAGPTTGRFVFAEARPCNCFPYCLSATGGSKHEILPEMVMNLSLIQTYDSFRGAGCRGRLGGWMGC